MFRAKPAQKEAGDVSVVPEHVARTKQPKLKYLLADATRKACTSRRTSVHAMSYRGG